MFTTEIRVNGALIATLHVHNSSPYEEMHDSTYEYEYYEPSVGVRREYKTRPQLTKGTIRCKRNLGMRHVVRCIFDDLDSKDKNPVSD